MTGDDNVITYLVVIGNDTVVSYLAVTGHALGSTCLAVTDDYTIYYYLAMSGPDTKQHLTDCERS